MEALVASLLVGAALLATAGGSRGGRRKSAGKTRRWKDQIKGGYADERKPSDFDRRALRKGIEIEMEHTSSRKRATEIAMDHLTEHPSYYDVLPVAEREMSRLERKKKAKKLRRR